MLLAETSLFDTVGGLPVHPLVVHAAVVLLPLAALLLVALVAVRRWRAALATPTVLALAAGTGAALIAKESGEALAGRLGVPVTHEFWGGLLPFAAAGLLVLAAGWWWLQRRDRADAAGAARDSAATRVVGIVAAVVALAVTGLTVVVGHSGATAVWSARLAATQAAATPATVAPTSVAPTSATPRATSASPSAVAPSGAASGITLAQVQQHATPASCWAVVGDGVYDLTGWVGQHPGGAAIIRRLCGTDATAEFAAQHGTEPAPNSRLAGFRIGAFAR